LSGVDDRTGDLELSVILPVHNEAGSLPSLWQELADALAKGGWSAEVIFVDDGSTDGGDAIMRALCARDPRVRLVRLDGNHGLSAAMDAGLCCARGRIVVTMDSDLQNDPRDIATLLAALDGWDAVTGWRRDRHDSWLKRLSSRVANTVRNTVMQDTVQDSACSLRAMRRHCLPDLPRFRGFHRFIPNLLRLAGHRVLEVPVNHRPRRFGVSHYGVRNRLWTASQDLLAVRWMKARQLRYEAEEER
jgi:glycosyltransferase involved in cell wall biosynthesis